MRFSLAFNLPYPPPSPAPPKKKTLFINSHTVILSVCQFEISIEISVISIRLNSVLVVGCPRVFMKEQVSGLVKSASSNIFSHFVSFGYTWRVKDMIPGLRRKDWILRALLLAVKSLASESRFEGSFLFGEMEIDADL